MRSTRSPKISPNETDLTETLMLRRTSRQGTSPAHTLLAGRNDADDGEDASDEEPAPAEFGSKQHFLIIDDRYGTPIHVFLELDPTSEIGFPGFRVRFVTLEHPATPQSQGVPAGIAIGQDPQHLDRFRMFRTDRAVDGAGFILIEPRYVGPNWPAYILAFRPGGEKPGKRTSSEGQAARRR